MVQKVLYSPLGSFFDVARFWGPRQPPQMARCLNLCQQDPKFGSPALLRGGETQRSETGETHRSENSPKLKGPKAQRQTKGIQYLEEFLHSATCQRPGSQSSNKKHRWGPFPSSCHSCGRPHHVSCTFPYLMGLKGYSFGKDISKWFEVYHYMGYGRWMTKHTSSEVTY